MGQWYRFNAPHSRVIESVILPYATAPEEAGNLVLSAVRHLKCKKHFEHIRRVTAPFPHDYGHYFWRGREPHRRVEAAH